MIIYRVRHFSDLKTRKMIEKIVNKLDEDNVEDYEVANRIPRDVISITPDPQKISIYIPLDLEYFQYEIDDFIRSMVPYVRTTTVLDRNIYMMKSTVGLNFDQYYKLLRFIIKTNGFCALLEP